MPIPRRNFDLGILPQVEEWMVSIALFLSGRHSCLALTFKEVRLQLLAMQFFKHRFVIEELELRRRATLKQIDDSFRLRREVWKSRRSTDSLLFAGRIGKKVGVQK